MDVGFWHRWRPHSIRVDFSRVMVRGGSAGLVCVEPSCHLFAAGLSLRCRRYQEEGERELFVHLSLSRLACRRVLDRRPSWIQGSENSTFPLPGDLPADNDAWKVGEEDFRTSCLLPHPQLSFPANFILPTGILLSTPKAGGDLSIPSSFFALAPCTVRVTGLVSTKS